MKSNYPVKKIITLNLWLTSYFFLFELFSTLANFGQEGLGRAIISSVLGALVLIVTSFSNLGLMLYFEKKVITNEKSLRRKYIVLSYSISFLIFIFMLLGYAYIVHTTFSSLVFVYIIVICILINTLILALQNYIIIQEAKLNADIENSQLKAANADAANQMLRQQIHPHFLFNALNILKSLYKVRPEDGEIYLIRLSDFLRAAVSNNNKVISLKDELKLCIDYLEMQKIRFGNALTYSISISDDNPGYVPSFSIQPLLENAIKHNKLTDESPLHIQIKQEDERITITNNLKLKKVAEISTGSGLVNLSERYRLLSEDEIIIAHTTDTFSVSIKILRHENSYY